MRLVFKIVIAFSVFFVFVATTAAQDQLPVFVSIVPQKYFVQQIGQDHVDVQVMVQPGASPATYEPKPKQMAALSQAQIYFSIGVPFEKAWLAKFAAANPQMEMVPTDHGIQKLRMKSHLHDKDEQGGSEDHHHEGAPDPHIWTSPPLVMKQARMIVAALEKAAPSHRAAFQANYHAFIAKVEDLDQELRDLFANKQGSRFMVFHPAWGYYAHTYGLTQIPVEIEGKAPKPAQVKQLVEFARRNGIKVIFAQPQFSSKSAQLIAKEIGGQVVFADPLAADWSANLRKLAMTFKTALK